MFGNLLLLESVARSKLRVKVGGVISVVLAFGLLMIFVADLEVNSILKAKCRNATS